MKDTDERGAEQWTKGTAVSTSSYGGSKKVASQVREVLNWRHKMRGRTRIFRFAKPNRDGKDAS